MGFTSTVLTRAWEEELFEAKNRPLHGEGQGDAHEAAQEEVATCLDDLMEEKVLVRRRRRERKRGGGGEGRGRED